MRQPAECLPAQCARPGDLWQIIMNKPLILVFLWLQIISAASIVDAAPPTKGPWGLHIGDQRQVFIDGRFIEESNGVDLVVHPPQKTGQIVLTCEYPWEERLGQYHSVLYDAGVFRKSPVSKDSR